MDVDLKNHLQNSIFNPTLRKWQCSGTEITPNNLMYPVFVIENDDETQPIDVLPGVSRYGVNPLRKHLESLISKGLSSIMLFGVVDNSLKDDNGTHADSARNPVLKAVPLLKKWFPELTIACNVCICPYTPTGHCAIFKKDGSFNNIATIERLTKISLAYAKAGADIISPSDMMDGRIKSIKKALFENSFLKVAILSYTAKFASIFCRLFKHAANSHVSHGDKEWHQLPVGNKAMAMRSAQRDVDEGADMLIVKPALANLDIIRAIKDRHPDHLVFAYLVSGEYAMLHHASQRGVFEFRNILKEVLSCIRRAGADVVITYYTPQLLEWMQFKNLL